MITKRYRQDELISSFHKLLRKGDVARASFFAKVIIEEVGVWRIKQYLFLVSLEETLSAKLYSETYKFFNKEDKDITDKDVYRIIYLFCKTKKKWEYKEGQDFLISVIKSETILHSSIKDDKEPFVIFGKDFDKDLYKRYESLVTNSKISFNQKNKTFKKTFIYSYQELLYLLDISLKQPNLEDILILGHLFFLNKDNLDTDLLKPFFKDIDNELIDIFFKLKGKYNNKFVFQVLFYNLIKEPEDYYEDYVDEGFIDLLSTRIDKAIKEGRYLEVPSIAIDEHTNKGRELLMFEDISYHKPLNKGLDLRYAGLSYGVVWRIASYRQYGYITNNWEEVKVNKKLIDLVKEHDLNKKAVNTIKLDKHPSNLLKEVELSSFKIEEVEGMKAINYYKHKNFIKDNFPNVYKEVEEFKKYYSEENLLEQVFFSEEGSFAINFIKKYNKDINDKDISYKDRHLKDYDYYLVSKILNEMNSLSRLDGRTIYFTQDYFYPDVDITWDTVLYLIDRYIDKYEVLGKDD